MNALRLIVGIGLIPSGLWLTLVQFKFLNSGKSDALGGHVRLFFVGIGLVAAGIIEIIKSI